MSKEIFCIPCKFSGNNFVNDCVKNIREYHPDSDILVIDSCSEDDSYLKDLSEKYGIIYDTYKNPNYLTGLIWHVYNNYQRDFYYFIHDSIMIERNIQEVEQFDVSSYLYFPSCFTVHEALNYEQLSSGLIGMNGPDSLVDWAVEKLKENSIECVQEFTGVVGCCFNAKRNVLDDIFQTGFRNILPNQKNEECQMERLWGMMFSKLGYNIQENSLIGNYLSFPNPSQKGNNGVTKYFGLRQ